MRSAGVATRGRACQIAAPVTTLSVLDPGAMDLTPEETDQRTGGEVLAALPLALLESVRDQDRPVEILEDEDVSVSLPRRLGLSGVITTQISRYESAAASGSRVPFAELDSLMRLVLRRPDAESIMRETGRRVARRRLGERPAFTTRLLRRSRSLIFVPARRAARRLLGSLTGDTDVAVRGRPMTVVMQPSPTAAMGITACTLYTGVLEAVVEYYCGVPADVLHARCAARGDPLCEWNVRDGQGAGVSPP